MEDTYLLFFFLALRGLLILAGAMLLMRRHWLQGIFFASWGLGIHYVILFTVASIPDVSGEMFFGAMFAWICVISGTAKVLELLFPPKKPLLAN